MPRRLIVSGLTGTVLLLSGALAGTQADAQARPVAVKAASFTHPGVLVGKEGLGFVAGKVAAGAEPWKTAFAKMKASRYASLSRTPKPRANVECGSGSNPNNGCSDEREDALAAYTDALMWAITKDVRYAEKSIAIMDAWSPVIKEHTNSNAPLQTGWSGASWSRAAEIIKHLYGTWPNAGRFATMLRTVYLPLVIKGAPAKNGNWELIMTDAAIGIAVFLDDRASFDTAVGTWRKRLPAYIYLKSDGPLPVPPPGAGKDTGAELIDYWQGQKTFVDGLSQETCRDFGHTGWGIDAAVHVAETARLQGVDLYAEGKDRLRHALGFHAAYELGAAVPSWLCGGKVNLGLGPVAEIGYNALHNRLGIAMSKTAQYVTTTRPSGSDDRFLAWETLTHAENPS
ncbi:alginate lyase family protein [Sphaerisporangium fuscum]|uniref:alginate lyase family protein n=1 Tax=Sphaerisporangium fuscum TaxID=2835868 RepID=UPI001BDC4326|nr:alginate lyase family protein [Sphaerisporangium fuscum]